MSRVVRLILRLFKGPDGVRRSRRNLGELFVRTVFFWYFRLTSMYCKVSKQQEEQSKGRNGRNGGTGSANSKARRKKNVASKGGAQSVDHDEDAKTKVKSTEKKKKADEARRQLIEDADGSDDSEGRN